MRKHRKIVGFVLWIFGACLLFDRLLSDITWPLQPIILVESFASLILVGFLLYNWLFGPHKGHTVHFLFIILFAIMAVAFCFDRSYSPIIFDVIVAAYVASLVVLVLKYKDQIYSDFRKGIKHNYFSPNETNNNKRSK